MTLTQKRLYLKLTRNSFCIIFPATDVVSYRECISSPLHVRLKQLCPTRGTVEGFVRPIFRFSCSDQYPTDWQPLLILIIFNLPFLMQTVLSATLIRGITREARGAQFPGALSLWRCQMTTGSPKSHNNVTSTVLSSIQSICFWKTSGSNMGAPNLLLSPGAI